MSSKRWAPDVISFGAAVSATDLAGRRELGEQCQLEWASRRLLSLLVS